jgi:hypothetical protein
MPTGRKSKISSVIKERLSELQVNESFCAKSFIEEHWFDGFNFFTRRTFDVHLAKVKKQFPDRVFKTLNGNVTRVQ